MSPHDIRLFRHWVILKYAYVVICDDTTSITVLISLAYILPDASLTNIAYLSMGHG